MAKETCKRSATAKPTAPGGAARKAGTNAAAQAGSKASAIIALLGRKNGATLDEMMSATGWQRHSVRGLLGGALKKRHGLPTTSEKTDDGQVYRIAADAQQ